MTTAPHITVRPVAPGDFDAWKPLWDGYNMAGELRGQGVGEALVYRMAL